MEIENDNNEKNREEYILIPVGELSESTLEALLEEFILREGTDYGAVEHSLEEKKKRLSKQVAAGDVLILYSGLTQNTTLMTKRDFEKSS